MSNALLVYTFFVMCLSWVRGTARLTQWFGARERGFSSSSLNSLLSRAVLWYLLSIVSVAFTVILFYNTLEF